MAQKFSDVLGAFKARERTVTLVGDGALLAEHEELASRLAKAMGRAASSLAGDPEVPGLAARIREVEAAIDASVVTIRVRGIGRNAFRRLLTEHPPVEGEGGTFDRATFPPALVAACSLDPAMTEADAIELADVLTDGQFDELFGAAWDSCREVDGVPFSATASVLTRD